MQMFTDDGTLVFAREIRQATNTSFTSIGYILAWIDFSIIIEDMKNTFDRNSSAFGVAVYDNDICLYSTDSALEKYALRPDGWYTEDDNFAVLHHSEKTGLTLIYEADYSEMQRKIDNLYLSSLALSIAAVAVVLLLSVYLVRLSAKELDYVVKKVDDYGRGRMPESGEIEKYRARTDEIGRLLRHFFRMTEEHTQLTEAMYENKRLMAEMEFSWLQKQIQPHLLYNTLSAVAWSAYGNQDTETAHMVEILGRMMRMITDNREAMIPVEQELTIAQDYISIQKLRYGSRLNMEIDLAPETMKKMLPKVTLQPLVENSVVHALDNMLSECRIRIFDSVSPFFTDIVVEDNGAGFDEEALAEKKARSSGGIGLTNVRRRIQYIFPGGDLIFRKIENGMQVIVHIPNREVNEKGEREV